MTAITINIPNSDVSFFKKMMTKMGWTYTMADEERQVVKPRLYDPETGEYLNDKTMKAIEEAHEDMKHGRLKSYDSVDAMFKDLGTDLPGITKAVMAFADWFGQYWIILGVIVLVAIIGWKAFSATPTGQVFVGRTSMKLPLVGPVVTKTAAARFARTMSTLLSAGISILDAIDITKKNMPNVLFKDAMDRAHDDVSKGTPLTKPITDCGLFPPMICHMVKIGEETGNIEEMLDKSAVYYEEEVEIAIQGMLSAMEPLIIILLAAIVGVLLAACLSPMMTMYDALDNL